MRQCTAFWSWRCCYRMGGCWSPPAPSCSTTISGGYSLCSINIPMSKTTITASPRNLPSSSPNTQQHTMPGLWLQFPRILSCTSCSLSWVKLWWVNSSKNKMLCHRNLTFLGWLGIPQSEFIVLRTASATASITFSRSPTSRRNNAMQEFSQPRPTWLCS